MANFCIFSFICFYFSLAEFITRHTFISLKITQAKRKKKMAYGMKLMNDTPAVIEVQCCCNPAGTGFT